MTTDAVDPAVRTIPAPDVAGTVARLRRTFASGRTPALEWRKRQLSALEALLTDNEPAFIDALHEDLDGSPFEAWLVSGASKISVTNGAHETHATRRVAHGLPAVHRQGVEAGPQAFLAARRHNPADWTARSAN